MNFTDRDLDSVKSYIKNRDTAILVIMFTDIVGYTRLTEEFGEDYVAELIEYHNDILTKTIQDNGAGKVIKYIGDSVMAIFSEPTKAVKIAQRIHNRLEEFNRSFPDYQDIQVRIGLHMGQVVVDSRLEGDILGRHVNRASRIEGLAGARQTYISYPVFDSVKSWLQGNMELSWKFHGEYFLKGITKPAEIYQVYNEEQDRPKAPTKGKKRRRVPSFIFLGLAILMGVGITLGAISLKKSSVYLFDFTISDALIDGLELFIDGERGDHKRAVLNKLNSGPHLIHYDISPYVRYCSTFDVARGDNFINLEFNEFRTPYFSFETTFNSGNEYRESQESEFTYYNESGVLTKEVIECSIAINKIESEDHIIYRSSWEILKNGEPYRVGERELEVDPSSNFTTYGDRIENKTDDIYIIGSKDSSRAGSYEIEIMFGWY